MFQIDTINNKIIQGDVLETLDKFPSEEIKLTVTSPPYYRVRSYEIANQWGTEEKVEDYLRKLESFLEQIDRITRKDGWLALNIGDVKDHGVWQCIPEHVTMVMKSIGWETRSKIVWHKLNAMPSSTPKGFSPKWEPVLLFAKSKDSIFHYERIKIPAKTKSKKFNVRVRDSGKGKFDEIYTATKEEKENHNLKGEKFQDQTLGADGKPKGNYKGFNARYEHQDMKRMGDVWTYGVWRQQTNRKKHPAPFPHYIPEPFIKACSDENDLVLDPFSGTGITCVVAKKLNRKYCGIELDPYWVKQSSLDLENV